ncbi:MULTISPECIES: fimbrial protein [unclassified Serratia (in: enterobacteria)]|uniref:fimbrial protein n=1 Tax=unclassified Serratia (in: enterobacteria) TaxID=2647522 RepID=UPI0004A82BB8|nr:MULTISPECIES: fimbrial protein [unclassified Serratia (in: enterobacteria)]
MRRVMTLLLPLVLLSGYSLNSEAFTCYDSTGNTLSSIAGTATANVYVNLQPSVAVGQNLVVDLSHSIFCKNDTPTIRNDVVNMLRGSAYGGVLKSFNGSLKYYGMSYPFPLNSATAVQNFNSGAYIGWNTQLYLTPISAAGGVVLNRGSLFASLIMYQVGSDIIGGGNIHTATFTWNLYANNDVIVPTGGCDISSRDVAVTLPEYPGTVSIPLTVSCAQNQNLAYYLTGPTTDAASTIFSNTASAPVAQGIGIQLTNRNGVIATNRNVALGIVGRSSVSLGLTANYARTTGQVVAGNVKAVVGVTFLYP